MGWTKATLHKEEYKGFLKLFLQQDNCALVVRLSSVLLTVALLAGLVVFPAPVDASFLVGTIPHGTDSGTKIASVGQTTANTTGNAGVFTMTFRRPSKPNDTQFALIAATDSVTRTVTQIYGDTMSLIRGPDGSINDTFIVAGDTTHDTVYLTSDTAGTNDTLSYVVSIANFGNAFDTFGLIADTFWTSTGETTGAGRFSYQFFNKLGLPLTNVLTLAQQETGLVGIAASPSSAETVMLRIYTKGTANGDTIRAAIRAMANNGTGRSGKDTMEVSPYLGVNGVRYGGSGNAAMYVEVSVSGPLIRMAETDTVFSPVSISGVAGDTQNYIPGSLIVYTLWFDNDGNDTGDTISVEYWIDTRHVRFDSQGLSQLQGQTQIAAAGTYVIKGYGNIFVDSAMPTFASTNFNVALDYVNSAGSWVSLKTAPSPEAVARIRWTISRAGGVVGASNGDDLTTIDNAPIAPTSAGDVDMGFVRFSVVIR